MAVKSANIIGGNGSKRSEFDFYPTPANVTKALLSTVNWDRGLKVWEPACGQGDMVYVLRSHFDDVIDTDIQSGTDFLDPGVDRNVDAIITNPPFSLAPEFIEKAIYKPYAAMLVKAHFWHAAKRTRLFNLRPPSKILALTWRPQFSPDREMAKKASPTMDFIWTVWEPENRGTEYIVVGKPK